MYEASGEYERMKSLHEFNVEGFPPVQGVLDGEDTSSNDGPRGPLGSPDAPLSPPRNSTCPANGCDGRVHLDEQHAEAYCVTCGLIAEEGKLYRETQTRYASEPIERDAHRTDQRDQAVRE